MQNQDKSKKEFYSRIFEFFFNLIFPTTKNMKKLTKKIFPIFSGENKNKNNLESLMDISELRFFSPQKFLNGVLFPRKK